MCIFSGPVSSVSKTKIATFCCYDSEVKKINKRNYKSKKGNPLQLIIYENKVNINSEPVAMILPFPLIKGVNRIKLVDLSEYPNIMDDIEDLFPYDNLVAQAYSNSLSDGAPIPVLHVGSYKVSIVPKFSEFTNLQFNQFGLSPDTHKLLEQYYSEDFGFIVCIIENSKKFHPIAYVHEGEIPFIPTRHYHRHTVPKPDLSEIDNEDVLEISAEMYSEQQIMRSGNSRQPGAPRPGRNISSSTNEADWDHSIFIFGYGPEKIKKAINGIGVKYTDIPHYNLENIKNRIDFSMFPEYLFFGTISRGTRMTINASYGGNHDIFI